MLSFILPLIAIIFALFTLLFSVISFFKEGNNNRFGIGASIFAALVTLVGLFCISVPAPTIYPLNSEAKIYEGELKITIDTIVFPFLSTYYSLDGTNPEEGNIYKGAFTISESTTVVAENRFLHFWWSEQSKSTYKFESIPITISNSENPYIDDKFISLNEISDLVKIFGGFIIVIYLLKISIIDGLKNLFR